MLHSNDRLDDRYLITDLIGQGGMSYVYRAKDEKLGRDVAIKILKEDLAKDQAFLDRFYHEASAAAQLSHPSIVAVYDIVDEGELHYIVMELVDGITLKDYIAKKHRLSNKETLGIALQVASGLGEAHQCGIIHRDIKPQNIIISRDGKIKVADFGIALALSEAGAEEKTLMGTAHYMAPECAQREEADERSDIYSLGVCMYEMITGVTPHDGDNAADIVMAHIENALVPPKVYRPDIYPSLNDIIVKTLRKDPDERYQNCSELCHDLSRAVTEPEGRFVKLTDSIPSSEFAGEISESSGIETAPEGSYESPGDAADAYEEVVSQEPDDTESFMRAHSIVRTKPLFFALLTLFIFAAVVLSVTLVLMAGNKRSEVSSSQAATESEEESETESEIDYTISISDEEKLPKLIGMDADSARAKLSLLQLSMDSSAMEYNDFYAPGIIVSQTPPEGELYNAGSTVYVSLSRGSVLDDLSGISPEEARARLENLGYTVLDVTQTVFSETVPEGYVSGYSLSDMEGNIVETLAQDESGNVLSEGAAPGDYEMYDVTLILSRGSESSYALMPDLVGQGVEGAEASIVSLGLRIGSETTEQREDVAPGIVTAQSASPGEYLRKGESVDLIVSVAEDAAVEDGSDYAAYSRESETAGPPELSDEYYYADIDTSCVIPSYGVTQSTVNVAARLRQSVDGADEYTHIFGPIPVNPGAEMPVSFRNIRGAHGVDTGYVEVYNYDTGEVYTSYQVYFKELDGE